MRILDLRFAILTLPEQRDVVHRTRTIERNERDDIAEVGRLHRRQRAPHAFRFQLEHAHGVARLEQIVNSRIIPLQGAEIDFNPAFLQQIDRLAQHG